MNTIDNAMKMFDTSNTYKKKPLDKIKVFDHYQMQEYHLHAKNQHERNISHKKNIF